MNNNYSGPKADITEEELSKYEESELWVIEPKMDGMWIQFESTTEGNVILSRKGIRHSNSYIKDIDMQLPVPPGTVICGELDAGTDRATKARNRNGFHGMYMFDLIQYGDQDMRSFCYRLRRQKLEEVAKEIMFYTMHAPGLFNLVPSFDSFFLARHQHLIANGAEGSVLKHLEAGYRPGKTDDMVRCKQWLTDDFVLMEVGETDGGDLTGVWGQYHNGELIYVMRAQPRGCMDILTDNNCGTLVAEFKGRDRQSSGTLRSAQFVRVRDDKPKEECVLQNEGGKVPTRKK